MTNDTFPAVVVMGGPQNGMVLNLDEVLNDFSIGSAEGCHLILSGESISPMHATLFLDDEGTVMVSDTKSLAGVFVNGVKVTERALADGDEIALGTPGDPEGAQLRFSLSGSDAPLLEFEEAGVADPGGLGDMSSFQVEAPLVLPEAANAEFVAEPVAVDAFDPGVPELAPLPAFEEEAPSPVDDFPPIEMMADPEPEPAVPIASPEPAAVVRGSGLSSDPAPATQPRKTTTKKILLGASDDPLAGLAESLGSTSRARPTLPPAEASAPVVKSKKPPRDPALLNKVARTSAAALVLIGIAWFGVKRYSASIVVPVIDAYLPNPAEPGQTITINGSGFGLDTAPMSVKVMMGDVEGQVLDVSATSINVSVPDSLAAVGTQTLNLKVIARGRSSTARLLRVTVAPKIIALTPRVALSGDEVTIVGKWLANAKTKPTVSVAGNDAQVLDATPDRVRIKVPSVAATEGQRVAVKVAVGADAGKEALLNFGRLPFVELVTPARALPGDVVTITGLGFAAPDLAVSVGGKLAGVLSATDSEIKLSLPGLRVSENAGVRDLTIQANQKLSIAHPIEVIRESSALYSPRFFVEVRDGSRAAVACELGPVMVLGTDAASVRRAHDAAARLNELVAQGRNTRVQFVAGNVVISASGTTVLTVAPSDGNGNARNLAEVWTAALNDMFDLFLQGRRPGRTVEISPDGKVFLDIYSLAHRRSSDPGVPQGLLSSPDPAWVRSLAALAISPGSGSGQATALLDGYWGGPIEIPGAIQPEKLEISLTATPSGVVGQRTTRQGGLSSDVSLQNLTYSRRELRFSFVDSGQTLNFQGRLEGDVIDGTVTRTNGARVGKLTLKLTH